MFVCGFIVTLNAFNVRYTRDTADVQAILPFPPNLPAWPLSLITDPSSVVHTTFGSTSEDDNDVQIAAGTRVEPPQTVTSRKFQDTNYAQ
jgi:hypothetical protein